MMTFVTFEQSDVVITRCETDPTGVYRQEDSLESIENVSNESFLIIMVLC